MEFIANYVKPISFTTISTEFVNPGGCGVRVEFNRVKGCTVSEGCEL